MTFFLLFQILFDNVTDEGVKLRKLFRLAIAYRFVKCLNICFWILYLKNIQKQVHSVFLFQHSRYYFCTRLFLFQQINVHLHPTKRLSYYSYSYIVYFYLNFQYFFGWTFLLEFSCLNTLSQNRLTFKFGY